MTAPHHQFTPEQYLHFEDNVEARHEYVDGLVYAMAGAGRQHGRIVRNLTVALDRRTRDRSCETFFEAMRVRVGPRNAYLYPDAAGLCGDALFSDEQPESFLNPSFVIEVLSPSTEAYDRGRKFALYRRIPTLREYVLVAQDRMHAERFTRAADTAAPWVRIDADGPDGIVEIPSIDVSLRLGDLYARVVFPDHPPRPRRVRESIPPSVRRSR